MTHPLSPQPDHAVSAQERKRIVERIRRWRDDIQRLLDDCAFWNEFVRKPSEVIIDIDPDGRLRRMVDDATRMLDADTGAGPIAPFVFWGGQSNEVH